MIKITTNKGEIEINLFEAKAPISSTNFKQYINDDYYKNTIFHRVIPNFMIQGGGMTEDMQPKQTKEPIKNEADNGKKNLRGTLAMARTSEINSATSQFFINLADNHFLDHGGRDFGYAVFAEVVSGMDVVDSIAAINTHMSNGHQDVPSEAIIIEDVKIIE